MTDAYKEILKILADVEVENDLPAGTLKKIYEIEKGILHLGSRGQIYDTLQGIVSHTIEGSDDAV